MDYKCRILEIANRAEALGLPLRDLCAAADVNVSTFYRWQQADANPRMRDLTSALDRIEATLDQREQALVKQIAERAPDLVAKTLDRLGDAA